MAAGCLYFCQRRGERKLNYPECVLGGWEVHSDCLALSVRRQLHPGSNKVETNPRFTNIHIT